MRVRFLNDDLHDRLLPPVVLVILVAIIAFLALNVDALYAPKRTDAHDAIPLADREILLAITQERWQHNPEPLTPILKQYQFTLATFANRDNAMQALTNARTVWADAYMEAVEINTRILWRIRLPLIYSRLLRDQTLQQARALGFQPQVLVSEPVVSMSTTTVSAENTTIQP